ncbi:MAG: hypothetical protein ACRDGV_10800 [Candidatus Limnocylindria bacterium]
MLELPWKAPPGLVFASACESARAARGARLAGRRRGDLAACSVVLYGDAASEHRRDLATAA